MAQFYLNYKAKYMCTVLLLLFKGSSDYSYHLRSDQPSVHFSRLEHKTCDIIFLGFIVPHILFLYTFIYMYPSNSVFFCISLYYCRSAHIIFILCPKGMGSAVAKW